MPREVYFFNEPKAEQKHLAGGKGGTLASLYQRGYPVPDGFIIMPAAFCTDDLPPEAWTQTRACLGQMRKQRAGSSFAVRSSALGEDAVFDSCAGQFETVLNVRTDDEVRQAVQNVYRSRNSARVRAYSKAKGLAISREVAVVIQQMVPAEISGVMFTADPVTGSHNQMTGNFIFGLGDQLVSGQVEPLTFTLERSACIWRKNGYEGCQAGVMVKVLASFEV